MSEEQKHHREMLTYSEVSELLGVPVATLYSWVYMKRIPFLRLSGRTIRFRRTELNDWLDGCEVGVTDASAEKKS
jgi:excisionase family DNA binding protein